MSVPRLWYRSKCQNSETYDWSWYLPNTNEHTFGYFFLLYRTSITQIYITQNSMKLLNSNLPKISPWSKFISRDGDNFIFVLPNACHCKYGDKTKFELSAEWCSAVANSQSFFLFCGWWKGYLQNRWFMMIYAQKLPIYFMLSKTSES